MFSTSALKKSLKSIVEYRIYVRGVDYYQSGMVGRFSVEEMEDKNPHLLIKGEVEGSYSYDVELEYDVVKGKFLYNQCSCPYDDVCKHVVALGLAFIDSYHEEEEEAARIAAPQPRKDNREVFKQENFLEALKKLGVQVDKVPAKIIDQLMGYTEKENTAPRPVVTNDPFHSRDYIVKLNEYQGFTPSFHKKNNHYQQVSVVQILKRGDLTKAQRILLEYIKNGDFGHHYSSPPDPAVMFPLLLESKFPVCRKMYGYYKESLQIELSPEPLRAEIVYEPKSLVGDERKIRHDFIFRMPAEYGDDKEYWNGPKFYLFDSTLLHDLGESIHLHRLTPLLTRLMARLEPVIDYSKVRGDRHQVKCYEARLNADEIERFAEITKDAANFLSLTRPVPLFQTKKAASRSQPMFVVDFDNKEQTLTVEPAIDYGFHQQNIAESVYSSTRGGRKRLCRRELFENPGSHIIKVLNDTIHHAKAEEKKEISYFKELSKNASDLGFTKTLKCAKKGDKQLMVYLENHWPALMAYAMDKGYPLLFSKDELAITTNTVRADFSADIKSEKDWLYFDLQCYCGDDRITLEKLLAFLESGDPFMRKEDGTMVQISNRKELEKLARLLKNFHASENGGFEGRVHNACELEYVMTCSPHYNSVRAKSFDKFVSDFQKGKPVRKVTLPTGVTKMLRPYQKEGLEWLYFLRSYRFGGILADDMGLGKTLQTLAMLNLEKKDQKPSLVVCPKTLLYNWEREAKKFFPKMKVMVYDGMPVERKVLQREMKKQDLVVVGYATMKRDEELFLKRKFNYAVLDESQHIKNHATKTAQAVKKLHADYRLALTGTPLENNVSELWSVYDFLMPGFLGEYKHFLKHYHKPIMDKADSDAMEHLRRKVGSFMLRRTKTEVLKELPEKNEQVQHCRLSEAQNILYQQILSKVRGDVFSAIEKKGYKSSQIHILAGLTKLRQVCNHPALLVKDSNFREYESSKLDMFLELVGEVVESKRKVLVFSQFTKMLDIASQALTDQGIAHLYLSGKTKKRQELVDAFNNDPGVPVFLISLKAGGTGLNLTSADTVIIFDPWWNPSVENQAVDRAHRIGQKKSVHVYRLLATGTIEEKIQDLKQKKQNLFNAVINQSGYLFKKLTWNDVKELFSDESF